MKNAAQFWADRVTKQFKETQVFYSGLQGIRTDGVVIPLLLLGQSLFRSYLMLYRNMSSSGRLPE
jgi:hypothetical protein